MCRGSETQLQVDKKCTVIIAFSGLKCNQFSHFYSTLIFGVWSLEEITIDISLKSGVKYLSVFATFFKRMPDVSTTQIDMLG